MKSKVKSQRKMNGGLSLFAIRWTDEHIGVRVYVYFNLHRKCFSVKSLDTGKVIAHTNEIILSDCQFNVSEKGRQRVIRERCKNVHAGVQGVVCDKWRFDDAPYYITQGVTYNPYENKSFILRSTQRKIETCAVAILSTRNFERILVKGGKPV